MTYSTTFLSNLKWHGTNFLRTRNNSTTNPSTKCHALKNSLMVVLTLLKVQLPKVDFKKKQIWKIPHSQTRFTLHKNKCSVSLIKQAYHLHQISCLVQLTSAKLSLICGSFLYPLGGSFLPWLLCFSLLKTMQRVSVCCNLGAIS